MTRQENYNQTGCGKKRSWPNMMYHPTYLAGWGKSCKCYLSAQ